MRPLEVVGFPVELGGSSDCQGCLYHTHSLTRNGAGMAPEMATKMAVGIRRGRVSMERPQGGQEECDREEKMVNMGKRKEGSAELEGS